MFYSVAVFQTTTRSIIFYKNKYQRYINAHKCRVIEKATLKMKTPQIHDLTSFFIPQAGSLQQSINSIPSKSHSAGVSLMLIFKNIYKPVISDLYFHFGRSDPERALAKGLRQYVFPRSARL